MASLIKQHKTFLYMIRYAGVNTQARIDILKGANISQIKALAELALNALYGVIPLTRKQKKVLKSFKPFIVSLASSDISWKRKKLLIVRHHVSTYELVSVLFETLQQLLWHRELSNII